MPTILLRAAIIYLFTLVVMKFMGKRQIGQLQVSELVIAILLSELAAQPITNPNIPLLYAIVPIIVLISLEVIFSFAASKSAVMKKLILGAPSFIIEKGVINQREMLKMRLSVEELTAQLRLKGFCSLSEVEYAILEQNGQLSVIPKENEKPVTRSDMKLPAPAQSTLAHTVLVDGHIINSAAAHAGKTPEQISDYIGKRGYNSLKDVFLMTVGDSGEIILIRKKRR